MIRFVVFDLGQVLASPPGIHREPADLLGVAADAYAAHYWQGRRAYDAGGSDADYWGPLVKSLGVPADAELIEQLALLDATLWVQLRPSAEELLRTVRGWDVGLALLSNAPLPLARALRAAVWSGLLDRLFVSAELGLVKPDPAIYAEVTQALQVTPAEIAFIDDRPENVSAAAAFGWQAHLWVDDRDSLTWLAEVCGPVHSPG